MNASFKNAIFASLVIHLFIFTPLERMEPAHNITNKTIVVDYVVIKEIEKPKEVSESNIKETPRVELSQKVEIKPVVKYDEADEKAEATKLSEDEAKHASSIRSGKDYINYYQLIREKIRRRLKTNYRDYHSEGEVYLIFSLSADGALLNYKIESTRSTSDKILIDMAVLSLEQASPFPPFPKEISLPEMSFNVEISFKKG